MLTHLQAFFICTHYFTLTDSKRKSLRRRSQYTRIPHERDFESIILAHAGETVGIKTNLWFSRNVFFVLLFQFYLPL